MADIDVSRLDRAVSTDKLFILGVDKNGKSVSVPVHFLSNIMAQRQIQLTYRCVDGEMQIVSNSPLDLSEPIYLERQMSTKSGRINDNGDRYSIKVKGFRRYNPKTDDGDVKLVNLSLYEKYVDYGNAPDVRYIYGVLAKFSDGYETKYDWDMAQKFLPYLGNFVGHHYSEYDCQEFYITNGSRCQSLILDTTMHKFYDATRLIWAFSYKNIRCCFYIVFTLFMNSEDRKTTDESYPFHYIASISTRPFY